MFLKLISISYPFRKRVPYRVPRFVGIANVIDDRGELTFFKAVQRGIQWEETPKKKENDKLYYPTTHIEPPEQVKLSWSQTESLNSCTMSGLLAREIHQAPRPSP